MFRSWLWFCLSTWLSFVLDWCSVGLESAALMWGLCHKVPDMVHMSEWSWTLTILAYAKQHTDLSALFCSWVADRECRRLEGVPSSTIWSQQTYESSSCLDFGSYFLSTDEKSTSIIVTFRDTQHGWCSGKRNEKIKCTVHYVCHSWLKVTSLVLAKWAK